MPNESQKTERAPVWHTLDAEQAARALRTELDSGLTSAEAAQRLAQQGPNAIPTEPPPSAWQIIAKQFSDPMTIMLIAVSVISFVFGQPETAVLVTVLVALNVGMGSHQELKAQASVTALASLQIPTARILRDGRVLEISSEDLVPGDVSRLEAGDLIPADGRIVQCASLETVESSLTGESAPELRPTRLIRRGV